MKIHPHAWAALALAGALVGPTDARTVALTGDGVWKPFAVDADFAAASIGLGWIDDDGAALDFSFAIGAGLVGTLTVVDAAIAGDTFAITNSGRAFGLTSAVPRGTYETARNVGLDFDAALADAAFSRGIFSLAPGAYRIGGRLDQSITLAGAPLNATAGALRLTVSAVPEPSTYAVFLAGLGVMGWLARRRGR